VSCFERLLFATIQLPNIFSPAQRAENAGFRREQAKDVLFG